MATEMFKELLEKLFEDYKDFYESNIKPNPSLEFKFKDYCDYYFEFANTDYEGEEYEDYEIEEDLD